jgi:hypothetical protein
MANEGQVASVLSTGGAGGEFERQLGAAALTWLLVGAWVPIHTGSVCTEVHFQARRLGWRTDDIMVEATDDAGARRRLLLQAKRQLRISAKDEDCIAAVSDAWTDFRSGQFDPTRDAIVFAAYLGTNRLLGDFGSLLTQVRTSRDATEFAQRLAGPHTLSQAAKGDYQTIKEIVEQVEPGIDSDTVWRFLTVVHVLSFDLGEVSGKDESLLRTLLQHMRTPGDTGGDLAATWGELKSIAGAGAAVGQSFRRDRLPAPLRERFRRVDAGEHAAVQALRAHAAVVLDRIQLEGPQGLALPRSTLLEQLQQAMQRARVVVIAGGAGAGKSAIAKRYLLSRSFDSTFAFAAEEFKVAHIDQVLAGAQVAMNWTRCQALLPKGRTFLVEGLERLLEGDLRTAFVDLLRSVAQDNDSVLLITCRDYHLEVVERSLLRPSGVAFERVSVPALGDDELDLAQEAAPSLVPLLAVPALRALLRNPFLLARAAALPRVEGKPLPQTEQELRTELWHRVVCDELVQRDQLPRRRAKALLQIAIDRVRSFEAYVPAPADAEAVRALVRDGIVIEEPLRQRVAPKHDVWEDWALLVWLQERHAEAAEDVNRFSADIGAVPGLRRAYRKWLLELVETQPALAPQHVAGVFATSAVSPTFQDDTLIGVLQSSRASGFLTDFQSTLLANGAALLSRLLYLIRVACKTISPLAPSGQAALEMNWLVPAGEAWAAVLAFVDTQWELVPPTLHSQVLAFVEDWSGGVSFLSPYPPGSDHAGAILTRLYPVVTAGYRDESERARVVTLALGIPNHTMALIQPLAERAVVPRRTRRDDEMADEFMTLLLKPYQAAALCRDAPALAAQLLFAAWFLPPAEPDDEEASFHSGMREVPSVFGMVDRFDGKMFPQSATQGPFFQQLRTRPRDGIRFIIELLNRACAFYGEQRSPLQYVEAPWPVALNADGGHSRTLWCNGRLWKAYRGTSVMPETLACALMALEKWCLEWADDEARRERLRPGLEWIMRETNNVALVSVVASVCMAHPKAFATVALHVLSCRDFFRLDLERQVGEYSALAVGGFSARDEMLQQERLASNALPHRKKQLEDLARDLQLRGFSEPVHHLIDRFRSELPPLADQTEADREWRLALDRMDLRRWEVKEASEDGRVFFGMPALEPDVQAMVDAAQAAQQPSQRAMRLYLWGRKAFDQAPDAASQAGEWQEMLFEVKSIVDAGDVASLELWNSSIGLIVATCVRDHWDEMDAPLRSWCREVVTGSLELPDIEQLSMHDIVLSRPEGPVACAHVLALMVTRDATDQELLDLLAFVLMHPTKQVHEGVVAGVSRVVSQDSRLLPLALNVLLSHTHAKRDEQKRQQQTAHQRGPDLLWPIQAVAESFDDTWLQTRPSLHEIEVNDWPGRQLAHGLIGLLADHPEEAASLQLFERLAHLLARAWSRSREDRRSNSGGNIEIEHEMQNGIASFVLNLAPDAARSLLAPLLDVIDRHPEKLAQLLTPILLALDKRPDGDAAYWAVWTAVTERLLAAPWVSHLTGRHPTGEELVHQAFLNIGWRRQLRRWSRLGQHFADLDLLFTSLPASSLVLDAYVRYLREIGQDSLPNAFVLIAERMGPGLAAALQANANLRWALDALVARTLFENLAQVRARAALRDAMMTILDAMVVAGSSAAFQLRDDFVTPQAAGLA